MKSSQQGARVLLHMPVVLGYQLQQQSHLFLLHSLDQEAIILGQEERAAGLAGRRQQAERRLAGQRQQVVYVVDAEQLPEALEDQGAVVLPLEAAAVVAAQVLADLCKGKGNSNKRWGATEQGVCCTTVYVQHIGSVCTQRTWP